MTAHMPDLLTWAHVLLCAALFWTCFCRAVRSDSRVYTSVRLVFNGLGAVAAWGIALPLVGYQPTAWTVALLLAICAVQLVTAQHWHHGIPERFLRPEHRPRRRRSTDSAQPACPPCPPIQPIQPIDAPHPHV